MKVGVIDYIDSAHYLVGHDKCSKLHGHTYKIEVTVEGENNDGMVIDFYELKKILKNVLKMYDHQPLNEIIEFPSCENLCEDIYTKLEDKLELPFNIRVWEGQDKWTEK
jgi:6-pyruvoyltetrahydropterin/6-carboxytetrahydropterin synthase|tara:strand:- start:14 stop:340 length:327 start_codon:yes stop_codon:yes gene_type:complete